jgi:hypothetical protein
MKFNVHELKDFMCIRGCKVVHDKQGSAYRGRGEGTCLSLLPVAPGQDLHHDTKPAEEAPSACPGIGEN